MNIITLDLLQVAYHTTFDSAVSNIFTVQLDNGSNMIFEGLDSRLYIINLNKSLTNYSTNLNLLNTVAENKSFFSCYKIEGVEKAREQQYQIG